MAKLKFTIHPLFFLFGLYFAISGKVFSFVIFTIVAVIHEFGHSIAAANKGYKLNRIVLMPYGAVIKGESSFFSYKDEIEIALFGPLYNLFTAIIFVALWWFFPETYAYTELAVFASVSIATINLIPAFPLDGGRIMLSSLSLWLKRKTALKITKGIGISLSILLFGLFIYSAFTTLNLSILFFSLFMLFGNIFVSKENEYVRLISALEVKGLTRGKIIRKIAISKDTTIKEIYKFFSGNELVEIVILDESGDKVVALSCEKTIKLLRQGRIYETVFSEALRLK